MALTKRRGFMAAQQCVSKAMKSPIYNLLHVCNYPDHQRWEKNINPQTFVGPCLKWSHAFPQPRASGLRESVCEFGVMAHLLVSDVILNLTRLPSAKAMSCEPCSSPSCEFRLLGEFRLLRVHLGHPGAASCQRSRRCSNLPLHFSSR